MNVVGAHCLDWLFFGLAWIGLAFRRRRRKTRLASLSLQALRRSAAQRVDVVPHIASPFSALPEYCLLSLAAFARQVCAATHDAGPKLRGAAVPSTSRASRAESRLQLTIVANQLPHVHLISSYRYPTLATLSIEQAVDFLLNAPKIVKDVAPMTWQYFQNPPNDGTVFLEWQPVNQRGNAYASDGYVWADPESSYSYESQRGYVSLDNSLRSAPPLLTSPQDCRNPRPPQWIPPGLRTSYLSSETSVSHSLKKSGFARAHSRSGVVRCPLLSG